MKLNEIQDLIKFVAKSGVSEIELETKEIKIIIKTTSGKGKEQIVIQSGVQQPAPIIQSFAPAVAQQPAAPAIAGETKPAASKESAQTEDESKYVIVRSPMIGTFYRSSAPDKPPFVNVGDEIGPGKITCIIEAMKLFNEIESDIKGRVIKVLANDVSPVEYDQPLFLVDPA